MARLLGITLDEAREGECLLLVVVVVGSGFLFGDRVFNREGSVNTASS